MNSFCETPTDSEPQTSSLVSSFDDVQYASAPHSSTETPSGLSPWPKAFVVHKFTYDTEFELNIKNTEFEANGTYFNPGPKLKSIILNGLAQ